MSRFDRQNLKKTPRLALRVSEHALLRFRERVEEEFTHRGDDDLSDLLNDRIRVAVLSREVVDPRDPGASTMLHRFETRTGRLLVAVVRDKTVVTVLDDWMARNNYPGWDGSAVERPGSVLTSPLADKIRALAIVPSPTPASAIVEIPAEPPAEDAAPAAPPASAVMVTEPGADLYVGLATECRILGQRLRALREHRSAVDLEIEGVLRDLEEKRERLLAIMNEGAPS